MEFAVDNISNHTWIALKKCDGKKNVICLKCYPLLFLSVQIYLSQSKTLSEPMMTQFTDPYMHKKLSMSERTEPNIFHLIDVEIIVLHCKHVCMSSIYIYIYIYIYMCVYMKYANDKFVFFFDSIISNLVDSCVSMLHVSLSSLYFGQLLLIGSWILSVTSCARPGIFNE